MIAVEYRLHATASGEGAEFTPIKGEEVVKSYLNNPRPDVVVESREVTDWAPVLHE